MGSCSVILYAVISSWMRLYEVSNIFIKLWYCASVSLFPLILLFVQSKVVSKSTGCINNLGNLVFLVNLLFIFSLVISMIFGYSMTFLIEYQYLLMLAYFLIFLTQLYNSSVFDFWKNKNYLDNFLVILLCITITMGFCGSLYLPFVTENISFFKEIVLLKLSIKTVMFFSFLVFGALFIAWVFFYCKNETIKNNKKLTFLICFSPILLFDVLNNFDIEHYNAYLGPAIAVLNGKVPLIDVFCQYGLSYLVFTVGYLVFPNNYAVASVIVSVLNIICWVVLLLTLRRFIRNPLYFSVIALTHLFGSAYILVHTANLLPSTLCMRYLPTILLSYFLLSQIQSEKRDVDKIEFFSLNAFNVLLVLNVIWSIETLISLVIIYAAYLWVMALSFRSIFNNLHRLFLFVVSIYLTVTAVYLISFNEFPNYWMYLKYIYAYVNPYIKAGTVFLSVPSDIYSHFFFWMVFAVVHLCLFCNLISYRFSQYKEDVTVRMILFFNVVCIVCLAYFILQPSLFSFVNSGYPSFILIFSLLLMELDRTKRFEFKVCSRILLFSLVYFFFFVAVKGVFVTHKNFYKNGDLLYSIFHDRGFKFDRFLYNLNNFCSNKNISPGAGPNLSIEENTCRRNTYHQELYDSIEKWYPDKKEILIFHRDSVELLMEHKKVNPILVNPINDSLVEDLKIKTVKWVEDKVYEGDIVIVEKYLNVLPIEYRVLRKMADRFRFILLEETPHLKIFKLAKKERNQKSELSFPIELKQSLASFSYLPELNGAEIILGAPALFDKDKETSWSVAQDIIRKVDTFWIWMDLGALYSLDNIKFWRKIDFRKPEYAEKNAFAFLNNFNVELSPDNKSWFIAVSKNNFEYKNKSYYESNLDYKKARYIRFNFFVSKAQDLSISEIEVFGKKVGEE
jgi:hypothetical protein